MDDVADACVFLLFHFSGPEPLNLGCGQDVTIAELAALVAQVVGYEGRFDYDTSKPDGTPVKRLDTSRINVLGWFPRIGLMEGIAQTYRWYLDHDTQRP